MLSLLRTLTALALLAGLVMPATAAVCTAFDGDGRGNHCIMGSDAEHDCCKGARIAGCDCVDDDGTGHQSEPARRGGIPAPELGAFTPVAASFHAALTSSGRARADRAPPHLDPTDRLTLFSIRLV